MKIFTTFTSIVNGQCEGFKLAELSPDNFKCLIFVQGLVSTKDAEIWRRVLNKLENGPNLTYQTLAEDGHTFVNIQQDAKFIELSSVLHRQNVRQENLVIKKKYYSKRLLHMGRTTFL